jgi:hypothetical protein
MAAKERRDRKDGNSSLYRDFVPRIARMDWEGLFPIRVIRVIRGQSCGCNQSKWPHEILAKNKDFVLQ